MSFKVGNVVKVVKVLGVNDAAREERKKESIGSVFVVTLVVTLVSSNHLPNHLPGHVYQIGVATVGDIQPYLFHADELLLLADQFDQYVQTGMMVGNSALVRVLGKSDPIKIKSVLVLDEKGQRHVPWCVLSKEEEHTFLKSEREKERAEKTAALVKEYASKTAQLSVLLEEVAKLGNEIKLLQ